MNNRKILLALAMFCFGLCAIVFLTGVARAGSVTFSWLPNSESDLAGYKLHYGPVPGIYTDVVDCGLQAADESGRVFYTAQGVPDGNTFYALTAYDSAGNESGYSAELSNDTDPGPPGDFRERVTVTITEKETIIKVARSSR